MTITVTIDSIATPIKRLLNFIQHPGTNTSLGLVAAALSQFTALVPASDRNSTTIVGIAYAFAVQALDVLDQSTPTPSKK